MRRINCPFNLLNAIFYYWRSDYLFLIFLIRTNLIKKFVCQLVIFSIVFTQTLSVPIAYGAFDTVDPASPDNNQDTLYDLIVLVVDSDLANQNNYLGLKLHSEYGSDFSDALGNELTIDGRIDRYAEDLVNSNELTDTKILFYDKESDDIISLISALENLYYNGDGTNNNQLTGVVLLGDIPLPVVNKNGNSFVSMFPYVDFQEKAYNFNPDKQAFELNGSVGFPKPEIWHGVMWADPSDANSVNNLATYLDKNHLYYEGNASFAEFDRKVFFADLVNEEAQMNKDVYGRYLEYLDASEDMAYMRYNKFWANEVVNRSMEDIPSFGENANSEGQDFIDSVTSGDALAFLPDIYAKQIIEQSLVPYYKIFGKYISSANDFSSNFIVLFAYKSI